MLKNWSKKSHFLPVFLWGSLNFCMASLGEGWGREDPICFNTEAKSWDVRFLYTECHYFINNVSHQMTQILFPKQLLPFLTTLRTSRTKSRFAGLHSHSLIRIKIDSHISVSPSWDWDPEAALNHFQLMSLHVLVNVQMLLQWWGFGVPSERQFLIWLWEWSSEQGKWAFSWWEREKWWVTYPNVLARNECKEISRRRERLWCCECPWSQAGSWGHCHIEFPVWATCFFFEDFRSSYGFLQ